jgi:hypothetical protein
MQLTATAMDQTGRLDLLVVDDKLPAPGDGGLPLYAKLVVSALVPVAHGSIEATGTFEFKAGWYKGMGERRQRLNLPRLALSAPTQ